MLHTTTLPFGEPPQNVRRPRRNAHQVAWGGGGGYARGPEPDLSSTTKLELKGILRWRHKLLGQGGGGWQHPYIRSHASVRAPGPLACHTGPRAPCILRDGTKADGCCGPRSRGSPKRYLRVLWAYPTAKSPLCAHAAPGVASYTHFSGLEPVKTNARSLLLNGICGRTGPVLHTTITERNTARAVLKETKSPSGIVLPGQRACMVLVFPPIAVDQPLTAAGYTPTAIGRP